MDLLAIRELRLEFPTFWGPVRALDGVNLSVGRGEVVGLVGESGCGKSVTALSVLGLIPPAARKTMKGSIEFAGQDLLRLRPRELEKIRGGRIGMIFQEPMTSLNPTIKVGAQIAEVVRIHQGLSAKAAWARAVELLGDMRVPDPERVACQYPHELSGGMRQRAMIAMALSCGPDLLIADEPTTALDVTVQAQVLRLLWEKVRRMGTAVLFVTHDLGVVAGVCHRVAVMYAGAVVESGPTPLLLDDPLHPYTRALLDSLPDRFSPDQPLRTIPGSVPNLLRPPAGCRFHPRCPEAVEVCGHARPPDRVLPGGRMLSCWRGSGSRASATEDAPVRTREGKA